MRSSSLKPKDTTLFCVAPNSSPNTAFWGNSTPASPPPSQQLDESVEKKKEVARRITRAIMDHTNPHKQIIGKKERKRIRRALEKIIFDELNIIEQEKNEGKPVPYIG